MAITSFQRSEMKFILNRSQFQKLLSKIEKYMQPDSYCKNGNDYAVYNLYYDTDNDYLIRTSLMKPKYKEKIRLRSYRYPILPDDEVFLELKKKSAQTVLKRRAVVTLREAYIYLDNGSKPACDDYMNRQVLREIDYFLSLHPVHPVSYISYHRMAFFGLHDSDFRITFDYDLRSRRTDLKLESGEYGSPLLRDGQYLMEVKINGAVPKWLADALSDLDIYRTGFSKYGTEYTNHRLQTVGADYFQSDLKYSKIIRGNPRKTDCLKEKINA